LKRDPWGSRFANESLYYTHSYCVHL